MKMITTISKGQQITIPARMREELNLHEGSRVDIVSKADKIIIQPVGEDLEKLFAETRHLKPKYNLTAKEMDELTEKMFR